MALYRTPQIGAGKNEGQPLLVPQLPPAHPHCGIAKPLVTLRPELRLLVSPIQLRPWPSGLVRQAGSWRRLGSHLAQLRHNSP